MQALIYLLLLSILTLDYFDKVLKVLPIYIGLIPEFLSLVATVLIIGQISLNRKFNLGAKYIVIFTLLGVHIVNGVLINATPTVAIVVGVRTYLKFIPFFLLPVVYEFNEEQIIKQLKLVLALCFLQLPMALWQKFIFATNTSGDWVRGTLSASSYLSILLLSAITMILSLYLKGRITVKQLIFTVLLLFIPTTINETKGTLVLLPIAVMVPIFMTRKQDGNRKPILPILFLAGAMFVGFVTVYDAFHGDRYEKVGGSVLDFFTSERLIRYVAPRTSEMVEEKEGKPLGRVDKLLMPIQILSKDPVQLFVGVGIGNVTRSPIKALSSEEYAEYIGISGMVIGTILWEFGFIGVILTFVIIYFFFTDARYLSRSPDLYGAIGLGWVGITLIIGLSLFYKNILNSNGLMYLFWYFSGIVVARRQVLMRESLAAALKSRRPINALKY